MINNVTLLGRLTAEPELKTTTSGTPVTSFCVAVERRFQPKEGEKQADFINCVAWRNTAEFITRYFKKGDPIALTGEIQTRKYKDNSGNKRVAVEVVINDARFVPTNNNGNNNDNATAAPVTPYGDGANLNYVETDVDDDLPF